MTEEEYRKYWQKCPPHTSVIAPEAFGVPCNCCTNRATSFCEGCETYFCEECLQKSFCDADAVLEWMHLKGDVWIQ